MEYIIKESLNLQNLEHLKRILKDLNKIELYERLNNFLNNRVYKWEWVVNSNPNYKLYDIFINCQLIELNKIINDPELQNLYNFDGLRNDMPDSQTIINYIKKQSERMKASFKGGVMQYAHLEETLIYLSLIGMIFVNKKSKEQKTTIKQIETYFIKYYNLKFKIISTHQKNNIFNVKRRFEVCIIK